MTAVQSAETPFYQKPLYKLLDASFQDKRHRTVQGLLDVANLAEDLRMTPEGVYKWIRADRISVDGAKKVIALSQSAGLKEITREQLFPFVMN